MTDYQIKQLQTELKLQIELNQRQKAGNIILTNYVNNVKLRLQKQIIYIATTKAYANQNNFKVGGCSSRTLLKKRLSVYNTGRPQNDLFYYCYIEDTTSFRELEKRIKDLLGEFRDTKDKEMYILHFNSIKAFMDLLRQNYNSEIRELNTFIQTFIKDLVYKPAVIPEPIILNSFKITYVKDGTQIDSKIIDLDKFDQHKQKEIIQTLLQDFSQTINNKHVKRKDFEHFVKDQNYKFKSRPFWKNLKDIFQPNSKVLRISY